MKKERNSIYAKTLEMVLIIASILITAWPTFFYLAMLADAINFDLKERIWGSVLLIIVMMAAIIGFLSLLSDKTRDIA